MAVGALVSINGFGDTTRSAVSTAFNALQATTVEFEGGTSRDPVLTSAGVERLLRVGGVVSAGLIWDLNQQQPLTVSRTPSPALTYGAGATQLSFLVASPSALDAIGARLGTGRFYDEGAAEHHQMVALLGAQAARQLGITSAIGSPAIFVGATSLTVEGILSGTQQESQALLDVIVPPYVAGVLGSGRDPRRVIARTRPGAAQLIGKEGPLSLSPYSPAAVTSEVPPSPASLQEHVQASLSALLVVLAIAGLVIGFSTICAVTMLSISQRRTEIGLLRAVGYRRRHVAGLVLAEAAGIGVVGGVMGVSVGVLAVSLLAALNGWTPVISVRVVLLAPAYGVAVGVLAGAYPAWRAATITPMSALRT